jgi:ADP-ribose pyrophosphatase YjhB (NUDIX family)
MRRTEQTPEWHLLDWISRLRSLGETGLNLSEQTYERERYGEVLAIAAEMGACIGQTMFSTAGEWQQDAITSQPEEGYITPKTAVAVAAFDENDSILLVKRSDTEGWAVPGGWADVGLTPSENAANEVFEETGLRVKCDGLVGVYDTRLHQVGHWSEPAYTLLFHGNIVDGELRLHRHEVLDAGLFSTDSLPQLHAGAAKQVHDALGYHTAPTQPRFD